jgi:D-glycero-alpha-D-manno-heptose-7-phosphate kinase
VSIRRKIKKSLILAQIMIIRSRAPLRIGLAGGGTDVSPFADQFGGAILNATISLFAHANIEPTDNGTIEIVSFDTGERLEIKSELFLQPDGKLDLAKGVYNRVVRDFIKKPLSFRLTTFVDAPPGSGLGTSSTLVVAMIGAFTEWLNLPLGEYDIAHLAFEVERVDLAMAGGRQDQYAATFGGFNFMEFYANDKVIVNPLRLNTTRINELEHNLILFNTETSRMSHKIIEAQQANVREKKDHSIQAMMMLKDQAVQMKEAILTGKLENIGRILDFGWKHKKEIASGITNTLIDEIYESALAAGATGGKISGAGGGGFMFFYCPGNTKFNVRKSLLNFKGVPRTFQFTQQGLTTWKI